MSKKKLWDRHQELMFDLAFPKNKVSLQKAEKSLREITLLIKESTDKFENDWLDTGVWGSSIEYSYTLPALAWLVHHFPEDIEIIFDDDELGEEFLHITTFLISPLKKAGLDNTELSTRMWLEASSGSKFMSEWLVDKLMKLEVPEKIKNYLFEKMELQVYWKLNRRVFSHSFSRFPLSTKFFHPDGIIRSPDPLDILAKKLPPAIKLSKKHHEKLIDCCKFAIYSRSREIDTLNFINERESYFYRLERGYDLFLFGMEPEHRLGLDSYQGFVLAKNSIPIAYGGGWVLFDRCEIGVSIFEAFRGGESRYAFLQIMRVYKHHFRIRKFTVDPYQFGRDNEEAIMSGAFWFYHRLGFRPAEDKLQRLAAKEVNKISANKHHRTTASILRRLAQGELELNLYPESDNISVSIPKLSFLVTKWIGKRFSGNHDLAWNFLKKKYSKIFDLSDFDDWDRGEKKSFMFLAPLIYQIKELNKWSTREKEELLLIMKAKGARRERSFVFKCQKHKKLKQALNQLG